MMRLFPKTSTWPANYRFAYILVWAGAIITVLAAIALALLGSDGMTLGIMIVVALYCIAMAVLMPRWALNGAEEAAKRARAKEARDELRRMKKQK